MHKPTHSRLVWILAGLGASLLLLANLLGAQAYLPQPGFTPTVYAYVPLVMRFATPTPEVTNWLTYLNSYRAMAGLPGVTENPAWSDGDWKHSRYCVKNDYIGHSEDPTNDWYTPEGAEAAANGNVMVSSSTSATDNYAIDLWMQGPFHALGILDPHLAQVGFGSYREAGHVWGMAATLDVLRGQGTVPPYVAFPVMWPANGKTVGLRSYGGSESPDPLTSCAGYSAPSGLPIILQLGSGSVTPSVSAHSFMQGSTNLDHCIFDETNYYNPNSGSQDLGRSVLNSRDAIVLIPRSPLTPGASYTVSITSNGATYGWTFTVSSAAQAEEIAPEAQVR